MRPNEKVLSASVSSMRVFQNRILSGSPSRSRGPGNSSRKKSASCASKERRPLGTILAGLLSTVDDLAAVPDEPDAGIVGGVCKTGVAAEGAAWPEGLGC